MLNAFKLLATATRTTTASRFSTTHAPHTDITPERAKELEGIGAEIGALKSKASDAQAKGDEVMASFNRVSANKAYTQALLVHSSLEFRMIQAAMIRVESGSDPLQDGPASAPTRAKP